MCEIFVMFTTNNTKIPKTHIQKFLEQTLSASDHNDDGWGAFWEPCPSGHHGFVKSPSKFTSSDIPTILSRYVSSRFFAFHLRYATTKVCYENSHPFTIDGFRGCHNGVVNSATRGSNDSDSYQMLKTIANTPGSTLGAKILSGMSSINGTYSVLLHALHESKLYYFRNTPQFTFLLDSENNIIYGATQISRLYSLVPLKHGFFNTITQRTPEENTLYSIDLSNGDFSVLGSVRFRSTTSNPSIPQSTPAKPISEWGIKKDWHQKVYGGSRGDD